MKSSVKELSVQKLQGNPSLGMIWKTVLLWNILEINDFWAEEDRNISLCCQRRVWRHHQCSSTGLSNSQTADRTHTSQSIYGKVFKLVTHQYFSNRINSYCTIKFRLWAPTDEGLGNVYIFIIMIIFNNFHIVLYSFPKISKKTLK